MFLNSDWSKGQGSNQNSYADFVVCLSSFSELLLISCRNAGPNMKFWVQKSRPIKRK